LERYIYMFYIDKLIMLYTYTKALLKYFPYKKNLYDSDNHTVGINKTEKLYNMKYTCICFFICIQSAFYLYIK